MVPALLTIPALQFLRYRRAIRDVPAQPFFVIPFADIHLIDALPMRPPTERQWINRGTDQQLRPGTVAMLLRTLDARGPHSPSVRRLQRWAGLKLAFATAQDRHRFAAEWRAARSAQQCKTTTKFSQTSG